MRLFSVGAPLREDIVTTTEKRRVSGVLPLGAKRMFPFSSAPIPSRLLGTMSPHLVTRRPSQSLIVRSFIKKKKREKQSLFKLFCFF